MDVNALRGQKRELELLELQLQAIVKHLICILGTRLGLSERATITLNC